MQADLDWAEAAGVDMSEFVVDPDEGDGQEPVAPPGVDIGDTSPETIARIAADVTSVIAAIDEAPSSVGDAEVALEAFSEALEAAAGPSVAGCCQR